MAFHHFKLNCDSFTRHRRGIGIGFDGKRVLARLQVDNRVCARGFAQLGHSGCLIVCSRSRAGRCETDVFWTNSENDLPADVSREFGVHRFIEKQGKAVAAGEMKFFVA